MTRVPKSDFSIALRTARIARGKSQEALDVVSGRTYVSAMERGIKQPTIGKVDELANALNLHPLTLLALAYLAKPDLRDAQHLLRQVSEELAELASVVGRTK